MTRHSIGQQLVADGNRSGSARSSGSQDEPARIIFINLRQKIWFERTTVTFRPAKIRRYHLDVIKGDFRVRYQRIRSDRQQCFAFSSGDRNHSEARQRE